jgi:hypothetical protein
LWADCISRAFTEAGVRVASWESMSTTVALTIGAAMLVPESSR